MELCIYHNVYHKALCGALLKLCTELSTQSSASTIPSHAGLRPRISIRVWPITGSRSTESLGAAQQCISDTDVYRLGAKLWTPAWEGIDVKMEVVVPNLVLTTPCRVLYSVLDVYMKTW